MKIENLKESEINQVAGANYISDFFSAIGGVIDSLFESFGDAQALENAKIACGSQGIERITTRDEGAVITCKTK